MFTVTWGTVTGYLPSFLKRQNGVSLHQVNSKNNSQVLLFKIIYLGIELFPVVFCMKWQRCMDMGWKHWASESVKGSCNSTFYKMVNPACWKEQKNCVSAFISWKIVIFLNFSPSQLALTKRRTILFFVFFYEKSMQKLKCSVLFFSTSSPSRVELFVKKYNCRRLQCFQV